MSQSEVESKTAGEAGAVAAGVPGVSRSSRMVGFLSKYGLLIGFAVVIGVFSLLRPESFPTMDNFETILVLAAPLLCVAVGLTVVLVMQDFDLSIGGMIGFSGAIAIVLMSDGNVQWPFAILAALAAAVAVGLVNGGLIAKLGASSFIITLAMGTILLGGEYLITGQETVFDNIPAGYEEITSTAVFGLSLQIWIAAIFAGLIYLLVHQTEIGRYMHAIGGNREAARLAGVPTERLLTFGFVVAAIGATICGILVTSQAAASSPNLGAPFLLPAFAGVFLGTAVFKPGQFNVPGTIVGVLFLSVIQTGLSLVDLSTAVINIVQGVILIIAVLSSRVSPSRA